MLVSSKVYQKFIDKCRIFVAFDICRFIFSYAAAPSRSASAIIFSTSSKNFASVRSLLFRVFWEVVGTSDSFVSGIVGFTSKVGINKTKGFSLSRKKLFATKASGFVNLYACLPQIRANDG